MTFLQRKETLCAALPDAIAPVFNCFNAIPADQLPGTLRESGLSGYQLASVWKYFPDWALSDREKAIAATLTNFMHPRESGVCYARTDTIIAKADTNQSGFERFMRGKGRVLFTAQRQYNKPTLRTLAPAGARICLIGWQILRMSLPSLATAALFEKLAIMMLGIKPGDKKRRGRPKKCEGLKEPQTPRTPKLKESGAVNNILTMLKDALQLVKDALKPKRRTVPAWKREKQRDINAISKPDNHIPAGFRGDEPVSPESISVEPSARALSKHELDLLPYYQANPDGIPGPLLAAYRRAGVWGELSNQ